MVGHRQGRDRVATFIARNDPLRAGTLAHVLPTTSFPSHFWAKVHGDAGRRDSERRLESGDGQGVGSDQPAPHALAHFKATPGSTMLRGTGHNPFARYAERGEKGPLEAHAEAQYPRFTCISSERITGRPSKAVRSTRRSTPKARWRIARHASIDDLIAWKRQYTCLVSENGHHPVAIPGLLEVDHVSLVPLNLKTT